jgi:iron complex outermembrane receptor protein
VLAQAGSLAGRVTDAGTGTPLAGATVRLLGSDATTRQSGAITGRDGRYLVKGIAPGRYKVSVTYLSYAPFESSELAIRAGETATLDASLKQGALGQGEVVVSASRRPEKITSAPASVTVVDARRVEERPALSSVDYLRSVPGLDIVQSGLTQNTVVARGFNNAFSGTLMTLVDNRIASVPSLRFNAHNFIPLVNEDIQQIEVIRGPGSALYGPNTANGVLHIITRSPFSSSGSWISLAAGERGVFQGMARHAGTIGDRLGYKISAQYMRGQDWGVTDTTEVQARAAFLADSAHNGHVNPDTLKLGLRDSSIQRVGGEIRLDYIPLDDMTLILAVGANKAIENPDMTGVGGAMARDWQYTYYQARMLYKDLFVQAFYNKSDAGNSYLLRTGAPVVDRSSLFVAQAQHSTTFEGIGRLAYGIDYLRTTPVTDSTITGGNENDDEITEVGGYVQAEAHLIEDVLELVAAGRVDKHSRINDPIFSPRAALVYTPLKDQTFRFTFNRAYSSPSTNDLFLDIVGSRTPLFDVRASGVPSGGFSYTHDGAGRPYYHSYSTFNIDPRAPISLDSVSGVWRFLQALVRGAGSSIGNIDNVPPPSASQFVELRILNPSTGAFDRYNGYPADVKALEPTINSTIELGYKGIIADRIALSVDLYRSGYHNFVGPLQVITPNLFFKKGEMQAYLNSAFRSQGADSATAFLFSAILADTISKVPFGVITPDGVTDPSAVMLVSRNYGDITLYGVDIGAQVGITNEISLSGNLSYVDKNFFRNLDGVADLSLNAPKFKYSIATEYRNTEAGFNGELRMRHVDGFPVNSGAYIGDVKGYSVVDLNLGYELPFAEGLGLTLTAQNLLTFVEGESGSPFTTRHLEFVGAPALGRLILARLTYEFK